MFEPKEYEADKRQRNKRFFTYVKHQRSTSVGVASLKSEGKLVTEPREKSEILIAQFYKAFSDGEEFTYEEFKDKCTFK